jgi:O-antigen/teichoic acid export membrane protein
VPEYTKRGAFDLLRGFLSRSRWVAVGSATILAATGIATVHLLKPYMAGYLVLPLSVACATLPFYALMQMQDGIARAQNWIHVALLPAYVVRHLIMLAIVSAAYLFNFPANAETAVIAVAVALMLTVIGQTIVLNRKLARAVPPGPKTYEVKTWLSVSLPILIVEGFYLLLTSTDIVLLHHFRNPDDVAVYYAAAKTLVLITFVHFAVSAAVGHRFSEYHVTKDHARLDEILSDSIRWTFWASLAATVVVLAMGPLLLSLFGAQFVDGYRLMLILAVGLMARASLGPVERLLNMLGEQRACAMVYAAAFVINFVIGVVLIPRIGVDGAAIATATALIVESVMLFFVTRRRLGFHVFIWGRS